MKNIKYINLNGITNSVGGIFRNVCEKNNWYLDLLDTGNWMISHLDTTIGIFSDADEALYFFMAKSEPLEPLTPEEEDEAMTYLESMLNVCKN